MRERERGRKKRGNYEEAIEMGRIKERRVLRDRE